MQHAATRYIGPRLLLPRTCEEQQIDCLERSRTQHSRDIPHLADQPSVTSHLSGCIYDQVMILRYLLISMIDYL